MKSAVTLLVSAAATFVAAQDDSCALIVQPVHITYIHATDDSIPAVTSQSGTVPLVAASDFSNSTVFAPVILPSTDRDDTKHVHPVHNISLHYAPEDVDAEYINVNVTHEMRYPAVVLEFISAISDVNCSIDSVIVTFNNASVYDLIQASWSSQDEFVMVTNHLGDCDVEFERGIFLVSKLSWDDDKLVVVASAEQTDVASTAAETEITFGNLTSLDLTKRAFGDWNVAKSYTVSKDYALPNDYDLFNSPPYINFVANNASFAAGITFSGHLKYNWLQIKLKTLFFDIDANVGASLGLTVNSAAAYNHTFSYAPTPLYYGLNVPGILQLGPELIFEVDALVAASESVSLTAALGLEISDGNVHLDLLNKANTGTSGWTPSYTANAHIDADVIADINPRAALTLDIACKLFGGIIDLSSGITAKPSFTNHLTLQVNETIGVAGVSAATEAGQCQNGLLLQSQFDFELDAFATQWWHETVYRVDLPIVNKCYAWA